MKTANLFHKFGGRITAIHAVAHDTHRGVAAWHFIGDVAWAKGKPSAGIEIAPWQLRHDDAGKAEADHCLQAMTDYLETAGRWLPKTKFMKDGRAVGWVAFEKTGRREVPGMATVKEQQ